MDEIQSDSYPLHPAFDPELAAWRTSIEDLPSAEFTIRRATAHSLDARRLQYMQVECEPIIPQSESENDKTIAGQLVFFAMIGATHVGFCESTTGTAASDPVFIQAVGVVRTARGRGIGLALMRTVAEQAPHRNIALATQNDNLAARRMNARFAASIGAELRRVNLGTFKDANLGIRRGLGYRSWTIERPHPTADSSTTRME